MSNVPQPSFTKDNAANLRPITGTPSFGGTMGDSFLYPAGSIVSATGSAATAACTLAAATGYRWVLDTAIIGCASIAANTTQTVTISDGTTDLVFKISANGINNVDLSGFMGAASASVYGQAGTAGAGSSSFVTLKGHKVLSADV
jgi:hypothetical protein